MKIYSKVKATAIGGTIVTVLVFVLKNFFGIDVPPDVAAALVTLIGFIVGFFKVEYVGGSSGLGKSKK